jgi:hypothetical protein
MFGLLLWALGIIRRPWGHKQPFGNSRSKLVSWSNLHGQLGWVLFVGMAAFIILQCKAQGWTLQGQAVLYSIALSLVLCLIWASPDGMYLQTVDGLEWYSNGRQLTVHLDNKQTIIVNKAAVKSSAAKMIAVMQETRMPIYLSTPRNIKALIRTLGRNPDIQIVRGSRWLTPLPLLPCLVYRCLKRSKLSWYHEVQRNLLCQTWRIVWLPTKE